VFDAIQFPKDRRIPVQKQHKKSDPDPDSAIKRSSQCTQKPKRKKKHKKGKGNVERRGKTKQC